MKVDFTKTPVVSKKSDELIIAYKKLSFQNREKEKRADELIIANKELAFQNKEKEKRAAELIITNRKLKKVEGYQKEYVEGLEKMMFMISHKIRQPITNILGISNLLNCSNSSQEELKKIAGYMEQSALSLDAFTKELSTFMHDMKTKSEKKNRA